MDIKFLSKETYLLYQGHQTRTKLSQNIIKQFVRKIRLISEAKNINELSKINSLNLEKFEKHYSIRLNNQYRLEFSFIKPNTIEIIRISKHYEK